MDAGNLADGVGQGSRLYSFGQIARQDHSAVFDNDLDANRHAPPGLKADAFVIIELIGIHRDDPFNLGDVHQGIASADRRFHIAAEQHTAVTDADLNPVAIMGKRGIMHKEPLNISGNILIGTDEKHFWF